MMLFISKISDIFIYVLNTSLNGVSAILAVVLLRGLLYKAPKSVRPGLWIIAALRLVFPATFGFLTALLNVFSVSYVIVSPSGGTDNITKLFPAGTVQLSPSGVSGAGAKFSFLNCAAVIWLVGLLLFFAYAALKYMVLKRNLKEAVPYRSEFEFTKEIPVYTSDKISSPFVAGIFKPIIYLPRNIRRENAEYVLCHEVMHIKGRDYIFKFLSFLILGRHWFNPFVWMAFSLFGSDIEMACDEKSVAYLGENSKKNYSLALLSMAAEKGAKVRRPLYFGEGSVKARVKNVLACKKAKPAVWILAGLAALYFGFWVYTHPVSILKNKNADYQDGTLIEFPAYQDGRNDYNSRIYDVTPFSLGITLPQGRYVKEPEEKSVGAPWTPVLIYNSSGEQIGTVGYGIFEDVPELSQDEIYKAAFRELRLSSRVLWLQDYTPVHTDEFCQTATSKTLVSDAYINPDSYRGNTPRAEFTEYPTATVFDRSMGVWAVAVFAPGSMADGDLSAAARSMTIVSSPK